MVSGTQDEVWVAHQDPEAAEEGTRAPFRAILSSKVTWGGGRGSELKTQARPFSFQEFPFSVGKAVDSKTYHPLVSRECCNQHTYINKFQALGGEQSVLEMLN